MRVNKRGENTQGAEDQLVLELHRQWIRSRCFVFHDSLTKQLPYTVEALWNSCCLAVIGEVTEEVKIGNPGNESESQTRKFLGFCSASEATCKGNGVEQGEWNLVIYSS